MKNPDTIKEAVEQLQASIQAALPGMGVTVSINLMPQEKTVARKPVNGKDKKQEAPEPVTLDHLRTMLNAFVKAAGKDKALALVSKYTDGGKNPADINPDDYPDVVAAMGGYELEPVGDA